MTALSNLFKNTKQQLGDSQQVVPQPQPYILNIQYIGKDTPSFSINDTKEEPYDHADKRINEIEDKYLNGYKSDLSGKNNYLDYVVQNDDTLFGLELQFGIPTSQILEINKLSQEGYIYPGMIIKLPLNLKDVLKQGEDEKIDIVNSSKLKRRGSSFIGVNLLDEIYEKDFSKKFHVHYLTDKGCIQGVLTINEDMLLFDPIIDNKDQFRGQMSDINENLKYKALININDINTVNVVTLPKCLNQYGIQTSDEQIIQIMLSQIGNQFFDAKYRNKLEQMKLNKTSLCSIFFRLNLDKSKRIEEQYSTSAQDVADIINNLVSFKQKSKSLDTISQDMRTDQDMRYEIHSSIPYFNLLDGYSEEKNLRFLIDRSNSTTSYLLKYFKAVALFLNLLMNLRSLKQTNLYKYKIKYKSKIFSCMPNIFRTGDWKLLYSTNIHGSSLYTLLRQVENRCPLILIIKDLDQYVFGAYISDPLQMKSQFYGSGETFLYTFQDNEKIEVYKWKQLNNDFILCDSDGIAIGCGDKYGLYINKDLSGGYTAFCSTFMNKILSKQENYQVDVLEVWAMDTY